MEEAADIEDAEDVNDANGADDLSGNDTGKQPIATDGVAAPAAAPRNKESTTVTIIDTTNLPCLPSHFPQRSDVPTEEGKGDFHFDEGTSQSAKTGKGKYTTRNFPVQVYQGVEPI